MTIDDDIRPVSSSGNLFRDADLPNADFEHLRASLAGKIIALLDEQGLSARQAQELTGFADSDFSRMRKVKLTRFSLDRLVKILNKLGQDVDFEVHPRAQPLTAIAQPGM